MDIEMNKVIEKELNRAISNANDNYLRSKMQHGDLHHYTIEYKHTLDELKKALALLNKTGR